MDTLEFIERSFPWLMPCFAFAMGAIVGSFLNVCIYRIPAGRSVVTPGSTCGCGQPIKGYDNIPIFSWFILRGKARCCGAPYSFRYPAIEALCGALFAVAWITYPPVAALCMMLMVSFLVCGSFIDLDHMEIPDRFSVGLAVLGVLLSTFIPELHTEADPRSIQDNIHSLCYAMLGLIVSSAVIMWIKILAETLLQREAMGFGDIKLMGGIGAFLGWQGGVFAIFGGAFLGCVALLLLQIGQRLLGSPAKEKPEPQTPAAKSDNSDDETEEELEGLHVPFGPMLAGGALVYAFALRSTVDNYFVEVSRLFP